MSKEFNDQLDQILKEVPLGKISHDEDPIIDVARKLRAADLSHRSAIRDSLRETLQTRQNTTGVKTIMNHLRINNGNLGRMAVALALVFVLSLVFIVGPGQGMALEVLGRLGLVTVTNVDQEYEVEGFNPAEPTATPVNPAVIQNGELDPSSEEGPFVMASAEEAAEAVGFEVVFEPTVIPDNYRFSGRKVFAQANGRAQVMTLYSDDSDPRAIRSVSIIQIRDGEAFTYDAGTAATTEAVTVAGYEALLVHNAEMGASDGRLFTILIVQADEYTVLVQSSSLTTETLVDIAASLFE